MIMVIWVAKKKQKACKFALTSIFVGIAVLTLKYLAYHVTGSIALYSAHHH